MSEGPRSPDEPRASDGALERAVSTLSAVAPQLDATGLAEALWLASRMGAGPLPVASEPEEAEPAPPAAGKALEDARPRSVDGGTAPRSPSLPSPEQQTRPLHERLPGADSPVAGDAVAAPRPSALPLALPLTRALRPWKRPWPTGRRHTLDLSATVDGYARSGELLPALTHEPERWFDLTLVVDRSPSMQVWQASVQAFVAVLDQLGAFRTLQIRMLRFDSESGVALSDRQGRPVSSGQPGSADGRRLIVVVSDCVAEAWRAPEVWQRLWAWSRTASLALLNPLPPKLWRRTGLDLPTTRVTQATPGGGNSGLAFRLPSLMPRGEDGAGQWLAVPVLSLSVHSLERWSRVMMLGAPEGCAATLVPSAGRPDLARGTGAVPSSADKGPKARTEGFLRTAAPAAARLAVLCCTFDRVSLDMLHVLRQELVPEATTASVAELLASGLFALHADPAGGVVLEAQPETRARLAAELSEHDALRLGRALGRHVTARREGRRTMAMVAGRTDGDDGDISADDLAAESTPVGRALTRTLELLGVRRTPEQSSPGGSRSLPAMTDHVPEPVPDASRLAAQVVTALLASDLDSMRDAFDVTLTLLRRQGIDVDPDALWRLLDAGRSRQVLPSGREPWHHRLEVRPRYETFWGRYAALLEQAPSRTTSQTSLLDQATDRLLEELVDPRSRGPRQRAGVVIAPDQASQSTVVIGLAAKALDAGYRLIVVMTGPFHDERLQTQRLIDEGLLGFDTAYQTAYSRYDPRVVRPVGVGTLRTHEHLEIAALTSTTSDFTARGAARTDAAPDGSPLIFAIKKNKRVVDSVRSWLVRQSRRTAPAPDLPLLLIDSATTGRPSAVDDSVLHLLSQFSVATYVSFAFAPFLPIPGPGREERLRYPDHFVHSLPMHRWGMEPEPMTEELLPRLFEVTDQEWWLPARHDATQSVGRDLPPSLREAVHAFVLAGAVRRERGQTHMHHSMLVSVSRFTAVQAQVHEQLTEYMRFVTVRLSEPGSREPLNELYSLWRSDFAPEDVRPETAAESVAWARTARHLATVAQEIHVLLVNSGSTGLPVWHAHPEGLSIMAVGGTKLARGTVLEGLTVGYYLRATGTPDTLLQLGSAFGYRTGYEDVCRLYVTPEVLGRRRNAVELHPGALIELRHFRLSPPVVRRNFRMLESFVRSLDGLGPGPRPVDGGNLVWDDVPTERVLTGFLDPYVPALPPAGQGEPINDLSTYVRRCMARGEMQRWSVQIASPPTGRGEVVVAGHGVRTTVRRPGDVSEEGIYWLKALHDRRNDEVHGIDVRHADQPLLTIYLIAPELPETRAAAAHPLVGFAVSLPRARVGIM
ncbi:SAV_2336 N-terminal domain-related protein [Streptomyces iakyrus]|uniref:SAV_2336 N-terminal domain-related protein n=1 Tax=Streptomyces iakyrus TaxID=68219 RepID=UPI003683BC23